MPPSALRRRQRCGKRARRGWGGWRSGPEAGALGGWAPGTPCFAGRPLQLVRPVPDRPVGIVSIPYFAGRPLQLGWRVWRIAGGGEFQSPTSRGGLCNRTSIRGSTEGRISFNPLLRGAASATGIRRASLSGWTLVSIPYFAGRPLQRGGQNATLRSAERSFNPLLRGAASATPHLSGADAQPVCSFNPLLRGAASATVGGALQRPGRAAFQSPTSRGGLCNTPVTRRQKWRQLVSIHYFAGRPLQPEGLVRILMGCRFSIPYFAGRPLQLPIALTGAPSDHLVSIPYFAGRPLQLGKRCSTRSRDPSFQSPTSRGGLCNRHSELGYPSLASPPEAVVVVSSSASNWEGGGQPPLVWGGFEVDHPIGVLRS